MYKSLSRPATGLERDAQGHRTGFKMQIKIRKPMQRESFERWGIKQRLHIAKHRYVWVYYSSTKAIGLKNGAPIDVMRNNKVMGEYLINTFILAPNETYAIHGWTNGKTVTKRKLTKALAIIEVHDTENMKFTIRNDGRLSRYFFRIKQKGSERHD